MDIEDLVAVINPTRTTLLFGAGASIPSGAPSATQLTRQLSRLLKPEPEDVDLSEAAQLVENRLGREALVQAVRGALSGLSPTAGLLALPQFDWLSIYTTNYDKLIEDAYARSNRPLDVYRSNYELVRPRGENTPLFKIHGCVSQDTADGHKSRMLITESDYDDYQKYRQALFNSLTQDMYTSDTVILGQSLTDRHLKDLVKKVISLRSEGVSRRVFLLVHKYDPDRAELYTRLGVDVVHAGLDQFLRALMGAGKSTSTATYSTTSEGGILTPDLVLRTIDVAHSAALPANVARLFNGAPASYADISRGFTISRVALKRIQDSIRGARGYFQIIEGARGVGKTTLARSLMLDVSSRVPAWEHMADVDLDVDAWLGVESRLRDAGRDGFLLVDDASRHLHTLNRLVDHLAELDRPHLRVVATVEASKWKVAKKSKGFFSRGTQTRLSVLERADLEELVALVERRADVRALVEKSFLSLGRGERLARLQNKCSAEMFVCMKNIFANDSFDDILLQEYGSLEAEYRDVYRYVAAVQSLGGYPHRQLIMRLLGLSATALDVILAHLEGVVFERTIDLRRGIYGWETRHNVIAAIIARLKFADQEELERLFIELVDGLNPTVSIELDTAIALATEEYGFARLTDFDAQVSLYRRLISVVPSHRTPRRRLAKLFLSKDLLAEASQEISSAERSVGSDSVLLRYRAQIGLRKAESLTLIEDSDRKAMLLDAESLARQCIGRYGPDVYSYATLGEIGLALASRFGIFDAIDDSLRLLAELESANGDPHIQVVRRHLHDRLRHLEGQGSYPDDELDTLVASDQEFA